MKDFKYFVIAGISLIAFVYVVVFMPSIPLLEDNTDDLWYSDAQNQTDFFENGIQNMEFIKEKYKGEIDFSQLKSELTMSIGLLKSLYTDYANTKDVYDNNMEKIFQEYGIDSYIEYNTLYCSIETIIGNDKNTKIQKAEVLKGDVIENDNGIIFNVELTYTNNKKQILVVIFYNTQKILEKEENVQNSVWTIFKILPKVEV